MNDMGKILRARDAADPDDVIRVEVTVPHVRSCQPARALHVGGRQARHPSWCRLSDEPPIVSAPSPSWGPGSVRAAPVRPTLTFHRRQSSFQGISRKNLVAIGGLGPHEQAKVEDLETDPYVTAFRLQSPVISWASAEVSYTADYVCHHVTRGIIVGEVKAHVSFFWAEDYRPIMENAERTALAVGLTFEKTTGTELHGAVFRRLNARRAYADRFTAVPDDARDRVLDEIEGSGEIPLGRVLELFGADPRTARQYLHGMLCRRLIDYDLDMPFGGEVGVRAAPKAGPVPDLDALDLREDD